MAPGHANMTNDHQQEDSGQKGKAIHLPAVISHQLSFDNLSERKSPIGAQKSPVENKQIELPLISSDKHDLANSGHTFVISNGGGQGKLRSSAHQEEIDGVSEQEYRDDDQNIVSVRKSR